MKARLGAYPISGVPYSYINIYSPGATVIKLFTVVSYEFS